jgi:hypothetical protein
MTYIADIIRFVEVNTGHQLNRDEGMQYGDGDRLLHGVTVAWMATPDAIQAAGADGHELLIAHESVYFPYDVLNAKDAPDNWQDWTVNQQRLELLKLFNLSCLRLHGSVDEISIFDDFADLLRLGKPVYSDGLVKVYEIPLCPLHSLIQQVKEQTGMDYVRVCWRYGPKGASHRITLGRSGFVCQCKLSTASHRTGMRCLYRG